MTLRSALRTQVVYAAAARAVLTRAQSITPTQHSITARPTSGAKAATTDRRGFGHQHPQPRKPSLKRTCSRGAIVHDLAWRHTPMHQWMHRSPKRILPNEERREAVEREESEARATAASATATPTANAIESCCIPDEPNRAYT